MIAAPQAAPNIPFSEIGVSIILSLKSFSNPKVTVNAPPKPPGTPISSPRQKTVSSLCISSLIALRNASAMLNLILVPPYLRKNLGMCPQVLVQDYSAQIQ